MFDQSQRYVVVPQAPLDGRRRLALLDTHTNRYVRTYRSLSVATSDIAFLNERTCIRAGGAHGGSETTGSNKRESLMQTRDGLLEAAGDDGGPRPGRRLALAVGR
jgi:hypothetical protein